MIELSLAEMMNEYDINHKDILAVMRPSGPANEVQLYHKIPLEGMSVLAKSESLVTNMAFFSFAN